jgi:hypothetical protein
MLTYERLWDRPSHAKNQSLCQETADKGINEEIVKKLYRFNMPSEIIED